MKQTNGQCARIQYICSARARAFFTYLRRPILYSIYYLLTESEVITGKSQYIKAELWDFPIMTERTNKLFIICPFHYGPDQLKLTTGQWITLKIHVISTSWARDTVMWHWLAVTLFDSCQLTITWMSIRMSTIKLKTHCICPGHLASNVGALQENSQSERAYYCSHIINMRFWPSVRSGWLDIDQVLFSRFHGPRRTRGQWNCCSRSCFSYIGQIKANKKPTV